MKRHFIYALSLAIVFVVGITALIAIRPARASATITVTTPTDELNNADGQCSLREAIIAANTDSNAIDTACAAGSGADTIVLPAGIYTLTKTGFDEHASLAGDLNISTTVTISGAGAGLTIIDGNGTDRAIEILPAGIVTITGVAIQNGDIGGWGGGAIANRGQLVLQNSTLRSNKAIGSGGGGLFNDSTGVAIVSDVTLIHNAAFTGGGLRNDGVMTATNLNVFTNTANVDGGGIFNTYARLTLYGSHILSNTAMQNGGGLINHATIEVYANTLLAANIAYMNGGGLYNADTAMIADSAVQSNAAVSSGANGGGIYNDQFSNLVVKNVDITSNHADDSGGGIVNLSNFDVEFIVDRIVSNTAAQMGGGVVNSGTLIIDTSVIRANQSIIGAGVNNGGNARIVNTSIDHNTSTDAAGIYSISGTLKLITDTISFNHAISGNGGGIATNGSGRVWLENSLVYSNVAGFTGGGINDSSAAMIISNTTLSDNQAFQAGGVYVNGYMTLTNVTLFHNSASSTGGGLQGTAPTLINTIIANNPGGNCTMTVASLGHNLDSGNSCGLSASGDITNTDPRLGILQDNGGATWTRALIFPSPAIDHGDDAACPSTDQRGVARPIGPHCDIGAYEGTLYMVYLPLTLKNH